MSRHAPPRVPVITPRRLWWADTVAVVVLATVATAAALAPSPRVHTAADTLPAPTSPPLRTGVVTLDAGPLVVPSIGAVEPGSFASDETTSHAQPGSVTPDRHRSPAHGHHRAGNGHHNAGGHMATTLADHLGDVIARYVYAGGFHGPHDAALRVLADPTIANALAAADTLAALDAAHQPIRWSEHSDVVVCTCGRGAHPCDVRAMIDRTTET